MKEAKTNAMRILESLGLGYTVHAFEVDPRVHESLTDESAPEKVGLEADRVFKTIVTVAKSGVHYVFMLPVNRELDLKKCAAAVGEKSVEPLHLKDLLPVTGYVRGGCSPIGMKKQFSTVAHSSAVSYETIAFSAGRIGVMMETTPAALEKAASVKFADIVKDALARV